VPTHAPAARSPATRAGRGFVRQAEIYGSAAGALDHNRGRPGGQLREVRLISRSPTRLLIGRRQSVHRVRLRKPKRLPFLLARVSRTNGQRAYVCSGCHRWSRCVGPAGARRACRRLDGLSARRGVSIGDPLTDTCWPGRHAWNVVCADDFGHPRRRLRRPTVMLRLAVAIRVPGHVRSPIVIRTGLKADPESPSIWTAPSLACSSR
jgi:hypothetical protein